jgi:hypothetical protein
VQLTRAKNNLQFFVDDAQRFRIGIEGEKSKNSTLHKTTQRIHDARTDDTTKVITAAEPSNESVQRSEQKNRHDGSENRSEHGKSREYTIDNRSDLRNAKGSGQGVGWKIQLCRSSRLLNSINEANELDRRVNQHPQQQDDDAISLKFQEKNEYPYKEMANKIKLPH